VFHPQDVPPNPITPMTNPRGERTPPPGSAGVPAGLLPAHRPTPARRQRSQPEGRPRTTPVRHPDVPRCAQVTTRRSSDRPSVQNDPFGFPVQLISHRLYPLANETFQLVCGAVRTLPVFSRNSLVNLVADGLLELAQPER